MTRNRSLAVVRAGVALAALVGSLGLVAWRQARGLEALAELDRERRDRSFLISEGAELERRTQVLESRSRVVPEARRRLGMRTPASSEIVILPGATP